MMQYQALLQWVISMQNVSQNYKSSIRNVVREEALIKIVLTDANKKTIMEHITAGENSSCTINGTEYDYKKVSLYNCDHDKNYDPLGTRLPTEDFSFTIADSENVLSPESSLWELFENNLICEFWFGYNLPTGVEWVKGSRYVTEGTASWNPGIKIGLFTIKAHSILYYQDDEATVEEHQTLEAFVRKAFSNSSFALTKLFTLDILVDSSKIFVSPTSSQKIRTDELLQTFAQVSCSFLCVDRNGNVIVTQSHFYDNSEKLELEQFFSSPPKLYRYPELKTLSLSYKKTTRNPEEEIKDCKFYSPDIDITEDPYDVYNFIRAGEIPDDGDGKDFRVNIVLPTFYRTAKITKSLVQNTSVDPPDREFDYTRDEPNTYVFNQELLPDLKTLSFIFRPTTRVGERNWLYYFYIVGEPYSEVTEDFDIKNPVTTSGQNCKISLSSIAPLTEEDASKIIAHFKKYLELRNFYSGSYRGFPEYDIFDEISIETRKGQTISALITRQKLVYNGALSGDIEFYEVNK